MFLEDTSLMFRFCLECEVPYLISLSISGCSLNYHLCHRSCSISSVYLGYIPAPRQMSCRVWHAILTKLMLTCWRHWSDTLSSCDQ